MTTQQTKLFDLIQEITDKALHDMTNNDQMELCRLFDQLLQEKASVVDTVNQLNQTMDDKEAARTLELKEEKIEGMDAKGNPKSTNKYTEIQITSIIHQELQKDRTDLNILKFTQDKLIGKIEALRNYITCVRDRLKMPSPSDPV